MAECGCKGCDLPVLALGMCNKHWQRNRKFGSPFALKSHSGTFRGVSAEDRFSAQMKPTEDCWLWISAKDKDGYGRFKGMYDGVMHTKAHRYSWELHNKQHIPEGMVVCHKCDTPACVNPDHLFIGTILDNNRDRHAKGRGNNPKGSLAHWALLNEEQVKAILIDARPYTVIAADYNVATTTIGSIKARHSWAHIETDVVAHAKRVSPMRGKGSVITEGIAREILTSPLRGKELAEKFAISQQLVSNIRKRRIWAHVTINGH